MHSRGSLPHVPGLANHQRGATLQRRRWKLVTLGIGCAATRMRLGLHKDASERMVRLSLWKSLFGSGRKRSAETASTAKQAEHKGFTIEARPYQEGGQYQTAGVISKDVDGVRKEHRFIRADRFTTLDDAVEFCLSKGRQIVDEQGDRLFG